MQKSKYAAEFDQSELHMAEMFEVIRKHAKFATPEAADALTQFILKAHDYNRAEVADLPSAPWIEMKQIMHPNYYVDIGDQRFYQGFAIMAGCGKRLSEMTREEEEDFIVSEGVACFVPLINGKIYELVHGISLVKKMPKATFERADAPHDAVCITIEGPEYHWSDKSLASLLIFQSLIGAGYRDVTHRSAEFPSNAYHAGFRDPVGLVVHLEQSDRAARLAGTLQHAIRSRKIIIDQLPNVDEFGEAKTTLTYKDGKQVGSGSGAFWDRQPKEEIAG